MSIPVCPVCSEVIPCDCPPPRTPDQVALRRALGRFATGVTVVTTLTPAGIPVGVTINSFASVSLEPPLVLWSLGNPSHHFELFRASGHYCINVLSARQTDISNRFASPVEDRFAGLVWHPGLGGAPVLPGCCATFEVRNEVQHPGGDHHIFVGLVERFSADPCVEPLIFSDGCYRRLSFEG